MKYLAFFIALSSPLVFANIKVANVKLIRGQATLLSMGKTQPLKLEDWVEEGSVVKTSDKSFVKLVFIDKSSMNVGPNSEMKIEKFDGKEAGVIDMVKGQIRSQVTKDYLQIKDPEKSKLFIKTSNAVMGVRGTDFMVTTNGQNTATVLFEGEVIFNSMPENSAHSNALKLDAIVDQGVKIMPGEFSVVETNQSQPTVPSVLNLQQCETLEKNIDFEAAERKPGSAANEPVKTIVPDGLSGDVVSNSSENLKTEVSQTVEIAPVVAAPKANAEGYISGDTVKPANGSFLHLASGSIVPPPAGSVLDPNTNTFIPAPGNGTVASDGSYVPPTGVEISSDGVFTVNVTNAIGETKTVEVQKSSPVYSNTVNSLAQISTIINDNPALQNIVGPVSLNTIAGASTTATYTVPERVLTGAPSPAEYQIIQQATSGQLNIEIIK